MALFDNDYYLKQNPDVAAAIQAGTFKNAYDHYSLHGQGEGRAGSAPVSSTPTTTTPAPAPAPQIDYSGQFSSLAQGISALGQAGKENTGTVVNTVNTGFSNIGDKLNTGFNGVKDAVTAGNTANTTGFTNLSGLINTQQTAIDKLGTNQASYFKSLSDAQDAAKAQVGNLQTGFTTFNNQYGKDVTRADAARADIQSGMQGGFQQLGNTMAQNQDAVSRTQSNILKAVGGGSMSVPTAGQQAAPQGGYMGAPAPSYGAPQPTPTTTQDNPFVSKLNTIRNIVQTQAQNLDPRLASELSQVASAFDPNGALIPSMSNPDGTRIARAIGPDGMLYTALIDQGGRALNSSTVNLNNTMSLVDMMTGSNRTPYAVA